MPQWTEEQERAAQTAVEALSYFKPGEGVPMSLWGIMVPFFPNVAVELVPLGVLHKDEPLTRADLSVLLFPRLPGETHQGVMHLPGMRLRAGDTREEAFRKIAEKYGLEYLVKPRHVENVNDPAGETGHTFHDVHIARLYQPKDPKRLGAWFPVTTLPENTLRIHRVCIDAAASRLLLEQGR